MHEALPDFLLRHRLAKPLALALDLALAALIVWLLSRFVWLALGAGTEVAPAQAPAPPVASVPPEPAGSLARWHLFGNPAPMQDPRAIARDAPETDLELTLRGIFSQDDPRAGHAIIADEGGIERTYRVGAEVAPGVTVEGVHADRVTLSRGGAHETLRLPRPDENRAPAAPPASQGPRAVNVAPGSVPPPALPGGAPFIAPNIDFEAATAKLGVDPRTLAQQVQVLPVVENGQFVGVRLSGGREAAALAKLGLQPDDVVTSVNGIPLDSFSRAQSVASSFENASSVNVTVRRGGKTETLSVSLR
ncbi:MAG TPA: type II secretion system protein N [Xanthomonadales bacterium]|nr:type II secretion system protein N [Xanthomonadales bacterium]